MRIFLDTADVDEIRRASDAGLIDGVTTNPSLMAKSAGDREPADLFLEICKAVDGPVSAEVVALDAEGMVDQGRRHRNQGAPHRSGPGCVPHAPE